jgi:2-phosphosulfolactate phosphatase
VRLDVAPLPAALPERSADVCLVVDVLRATTTIATLLARGVRAVEIVGSVEEAVARRGALPGAFACGEVGGLPPPGFDYGNSPAEFAALACADRTAILYTSNGTRALRRVAGAPAVFAGALVNRRSVVRAALEAARRLSAGLMIVCSGTALGTAFALEDFFCAGALVEEALRSDGEALELGDGAVAALRMCEGFDRDARVAFAAAEHGRALAALGFANDLAFCARVDEFSVVPLAMVEGERVVLRAAQV